MSSNFSDEPSSVEIVRSWAERNGFAHWAIAVLWLIAALVLFQLVAGLVFVGMMFATGELTSAENIAEVMSSRLDLLFIGNSVGQVLFIGLATFLIVRLHLSTETTSSFIRFKWDDNTLVYILLGALVVVVVQPLVIYLGYLNSLVPLPDSLTDMQVSQYQMIEDFLTTDGIIWFGLFHIALIPAFCEEILFRGYVLRAFEKSWGIVVAVIVSGIIFGLFHIQLANLLPLATLGVILALMTWLSGSLWPAIVAHFINNGAAVLVGASYPELMFADTTYEDLPPFWILLLSLLFTIGIVHYMYKNSTSHK